MKDVIDSFAFKKSLGQNFMRDQNIVRKIVNQAEMLPNSLVIEIGPGAGALTRELSVVAKKVLAYEIDTRLEDILDKVLKDYRNVTVIYDDFLRRNIKRDLEKEEYQHLYVVANLPYYITTPIIEKIITDQLGVDRIVIMVQKEVGDRLAAKPGGREYGSLTVYLNYYFTIEKLFIVNRECFVPRPHIDSMVVGLTRREKLEEVFSEEKFLQLIRDSFRFKRKTLRNNLRSYDLEKIAKVLAGHHLDLSVRAEQLSSSIYVELANALFIK